MRVILLFLVLVPVMAWAERFSLKQDFLYFQTHPKMTLSEAENNFLKEYHFVFVAGFLNERAKLRYFTDNVKAMKVMGFKYITVLSPSSSTPMSENRAWLRTRVLEAYQRHDSRPMILFGHSKGGIESLAMMLETPEMWGKVEKVITLQSPVNGLMLLDEELPFAKKLKFFPFNGMISLSKEEVRKIVHNKIRALTPEQRTLFENRIFYISSFRRPKEMALPLRPIGYVMSKRARNDGVMAAKNMHLPGFGEWMGEVTGDHTELVFSPVRGLNRATKEKSRAFIQAVLRNLYKTWDAF